MRNQLLKEFNDFKELPLTKILKNQLKDNNDIGFPNFKFNGPDVIGICYSCKEIANILTFLLEKFTNFKDKYTPGFLARFGLFITRNSSEIKFVYKIAALSKELVGEIKHFGFLNADINDKSIKLSLSGYSLKDEEKTNWIYTKEFFLFILHKANTFEKNNIYGSSHKRVLPDNGLREVIGNMLKNAIDSSEKLRDILPFLSNNIEELQQRLNQLLLRLETDKNLDWVQDEITKNIFWVFEMLVSTFIENKNTILEILNDTRAAKERKDEDLMDKNLTALRNFLVEFSNSYADKKFGASEESNLHESVKFLRNKILTELPRNKDISKIIGDCIQVFLDNFDDSEDAEGSGANVSFNDYGSLGISSNTDDSDEIVKKILYELVSEGILCITRFLMCFC
ncbi:hypothetical protein CWI37_0778p0010 [Hamiltosporidium tvaerminnensis]|uniref:Uncharacterized protein n=1 Tax=Hamiltosporidium tvaerminnensis TaxID=1176355 RepID=A0A4Q9L1F0_9MICR|nr:hypothetical protein CWI37_0778p0010 [Hamiltosporidium tvaerminnensis]